MKRNSTPKLNSGRRSQCGQALVEGTVMLSVMTTVLAMLFLLVLNTYFISESNVKLQFAASHAAKRISDAKWWLGMERPDYHQESAESDAKLALDNELHALGLPSASNFTASYSSVMLRQKSVTIVRIDFDVDGLQLCSGLCFSGAAKLHGNGIASDADHAVTPHGRALILAEDPNTGVRHGIRVPVYNATNGNDTPAHPTFLNAGISAGKYPVANLSIQCNTAGSRIARFINPAPNQTVQTRNLVWNVSR